MQNKAEPMTGKEVVGYRTLSKDEFEMMNRLKEHSREFIKLLEEADRLNVTLEQSGEIKNHHRAFSQRWLAMAKTDMQTACMKACRAVAKPDEDC